MSKLDPTSESLDSILASIRRSLAEQSTDVLADDSAPPPVPVDILGDVVPGDEAPPRFLAKGGGHDAPRAGIPLPTDVPFPTGLAIPADRAFAGLDDPPPPTSIRTALSRPDTRPNEGPPVPAAPVAAPSAEEEDSPDPLWFLARPDAREKAADAITAPTPGVSPQPRPTPIAPASVAPVPVAPIPVAPAQVAPTRPPAPAGPVLAPSAASKPQLKEIVRGPLPPFFGSSPEAASVEMSPAPPIPPQFPLPGNAVIPPATPPPAPPVAFIETELPHATVPEQAVPAAPPAGLVAHEGLPNGRANSVPAPPLADGAAAPAVSAPQLQGLEAMVADLLRPMLRRWLDENMPRLVSVALKAESETEINRGPKKP